MTPRDLSGDSGIGDPDMRPDADPTIDNPDFRPADEVQVNDGNLRPGDDVALHEVNDRPADGGIDNPDIRPGDASASGGISTTPGADSGIVINWKPFAIGAVVVGVVIVAAFSFLKPGATPGSSAAPGATGGAAGPAAPENANLVVTGADVSGTWALDGGADVSPTTEIIAAVWTETVDNVDAGYGDLIVLSMGGPVFEGTQVTSSSGTSLGISISRFDAAGNDLFDHTFSSRNGECQVTMQRTSTGVSGTFTCTGIKDGDGHTANATGSFAT